MNYTECFAVPGRTMIDVIDSATGLTVIYGKTLEQVRAETHVYADYANAERMTIDAYCASKAKAQDTPITWEPTTEEAYWDMLEAVPPACRWRGGFLCGEPYDHHALTGESLHSCMREWNERYYRTSRPVTITEFRALMQKGMKS